LYTHNDEWSFDRYREYYVIHSDGGQWSAVAGQPLAVEREALSVCRCQQQPTTYDGHGRQINRGAV